MRTRERQLWLGFIEQASAFFAVVAAAVVRSPSADFWPSLAMLILAYVGGIMVATAIIDRQLPFGQRRRDGQPEVDVSLWIVGAGGILVFLALDSAFHWDRWPPSVSMFAVVVASIAAGTIGWGIAASDVLAPVTGPLGRFFHRSMPAA
jgi:hypothetical protein